MVGCRATHHSSIVNNTVQQNTTTQPSKVKDCKDCDIVKQYIKLHFRKERWEYLSNKDRTTGLRKVEGVGSVYYSNINFDSLIHTPNVQKCFTEKCFTLIDAKYVFGSDVNYNSNNYKSGITLPFTTGRNCPKCSLVTNSEIEIVADSLNYLTFITLIKFHPTDQDIIISH